MKIYLAGGCFWGVQAYFDLVSGVESSLVGYANSPIKNPSYEVVCSGCGAIEAVEINLDSNYLDSILSHFFNIIDPFSINKQGNDYGIQYKSGIYCISEQVLKKVKEFADNLNKNFSRPFAVEIKMLENFYKAEEYHQKYLEKNPNGYCHIDLSKARI